MTRFTQFNTSYTTAATTAFDDTNTPQIAPVTNVQDALEAIADLGISQVDVVADITARNALTPDIGDVAKVLDSFDDTGLNEPQTYIWDGAAWVSIQETSDVVSVNGQTQIVVLDTDDIAEGVTNLYYTEGRVSANIDVSANTAARHDALTIAVDGVSDDALSVNASQVLTANLATPTTDGVMSSADKTKLDGIAAGANNYVHPNHTGDVTSVGDGAQTIEPNVVDNTKLADVGNNTIKGRIDPGTGNPQDLSPIDVRTIINVEDGAAADQVASEVPVTPAGNLTSTDTQAALQELQGDIDALTPLSHLPVSPLDDSIIVSGTQQLSVNLDATTGGGDNKLTLTALEGLYVEPVKVSDDSLTLSGQTLNVNIDTVTGGGDNILVLTAGQGLYVPPPGAGTTNLAIANNTATTLDVTSDTGTDATIPAATGTTAGLLTAADKTKLDTVETNAAADQIASEVPVTPVGDLTSTNVQAALQELQGDIDSLEVDQHVAVTVTDDSLNLAGQALNVNLDTTTGGGNNILSLTAVEGLYVPPPPVTSVNGFTGIISLDTDDIPEGATNLYYTETRVSANTDVAANTAARHVAVTIADDSITASGTDNQTLVVNLDTVTGGGNNALVLTAGQGLYVPPDTNATNLGIANNTAVTLDVTSDTGTDATIPAATGTTAGLLTATDKTKLDGIETGATADQNAAEVPYDNSTSLLVATDVQAAIDELDSSVDSLLLSAHNPLTLNAGTITQDSANLVGQELELVAATDTNAGVVTDTAQTFGGTKTFAGADFPIIIDADGSASNLEIGFFPSVSPTCYGVRQDGLSGYFCFMPNATNPQIVMGDPGNTTGAAFVDVDNNRPLNLNVLDTGVGVTPGIVNIGAGGLNIIAGGDITLGVGNTVDGIDVSSPINSIEVSGTSYQLVNDAAAPGNDQYYGTDGTGTKGWYTLPSSNPNSIALLQTNGGTDNTINYNTVAVTPVTLSTVTQVDAPDFTWTGGSNTLTFNFTGIVEVGYTMPIFSTGARNHINVRLRVNGTTEYGNSYTYIRSASGHNNASASGTVLISVTSGDTLQLITSRAGNNATATNITDTAQLWARRVQ